MKISSPLALCIFLAVLLTCAAPAAGSTLKLNVDAGPEPFTQVIHVDKGDLIQAKATGKINYCAGETRCEATPDGSLVGESICPDVGICGALVGKFPGKPTFVIGKSSVFRAPRSGAFKLGVSDFPSEQGNNIGSFHVTLKISGNLVQVSGLVTKRSCVALVSVTGGTHTLIEGQPPGAPPSQPRTCVNNDGGDRSDVPDIRGAGGVRVRLAGKSASKTTTTRGDGSFAFLVKKGTYQLSAPGQKTHPKSLTVDASRNQSGQDLQLCRVPPGGMYPKDLPCDLVEVSGRIRDIHGTPVSGRDVLITGSRAFNNLTVQDVTTTDADGRFQLFAERGKPASLLASLTGTFQSGKSMAHLLMYFGDTSFLSVATDSDSDLNLTMTPKTTTPGDERDTLQIKAWGVLFDSTSTYRMTIDAVDQSSLQGQCQYAAQSLESQPLGDFPGVLPDFVFRPTRLSEYCPGDWRAELELLNADGSTEVILRNTFTIP
jgi:hypothetical protein